MEVHPRASQGVLEEVWIGPATAWHQHNTAPPASAACGGLRPNRPEAGSVGTEMWLDGRELNLEAERRAGSEALNVIGQPKMGLTKYK